jgi:hypothetical protein
MMLMMMVEETPSGSLWLPPRRASKNHQFLSDEIIAELARQCVVRCLFCVFLLFLCMLTYRLDAERMSVTVLPMLRRNAREPTPNDAKSTSIATSFNVC